MVVNILTPLIGLTWSTVCVINKTFHSMCNIQDYRVYDGRKEREHNP